MIRFAVAPCIAPSNRRDPAAPKVRQQLLWFWCPGCNQAHACTVESEQPFDGPVWRMTGSEDAPTLEPSILVRSGADGQRTTCHSFLREGRLHFLSDCTHALAGQVVEPVELPSYLTHLRRTPGPGDDQAAS